MSGLRHISPPWDQRLARMLVRPLTGTAVTPNQVTTFSLVLGLGGAGLFACGGSAMHWGAALYVLAQFVDHMDGELARQTARTSRFGHFYDHASGAAVEAAMFVGVGFGLTASGYGPWTSALGLVAGGAVLVTTTLRLEMSRRHGDAAIAQPSWGGFEIEDIMYCVAPVTWLGLLGPFLVLAAVGTPIYMAVTLIEFWRAGRSRAGIGGGA